MKVRRNSSEGTWELFDDAGTKIDSTPILRNGLISSSETGGRFMMNKILNRMLEGQKLIREILDTRENYAVILMPNWVDLAEEHCGY